MAAGISPAGPDPVSIPAAPTVAAASSITVWPWSSDMIFWIDASGPGVRPASRALSVRSWLRRSTSASQYAEATRSRRIGSDTPPLCFTSSISFCAVGPRLHRTPPEESPILSLASVTLARRQPSPSSPTRRLAGRRTSSKNTWLNECAVVMSTMGLIDTPVASMGQMKKEMPRCLGTSGSVRAMRIPNWLWWAPLDQIFEPFTT